MKRSTTLKISIILLIGLFTIIISNSSLISSSLHITGLEPIQKNLNQLDNSNKEITEKQFIKVTGTGIVKIAPEVAKIRFSIETQDNSLSQANTIHQEKIKNLTAILNDDNLTTIYFNSYPIYNYENGKDIVAYEIYNTFEIITEDIDEVSLIIDNLLANNVTNIESIDYTLKDNSTAYSTALEYALENAKSKAQTLTQNASNLKVIKICEQSYFYNPISYPVMLLAKNSDNLNYIFTPSEIEIIANIEVEFAY